MGSLRPVPCLPGIPCIIYLSRPISKNYLEYSRTLQVSPPPKKKEIRMGSLRPVPCLPGIQCEYSRTLRVSPPPKKRNTNGVPGVEWTVAVGQPPEATASLPDRLCAVHREVTRLPQRAVRLRHPHGRGSPHCTSSSQIWLSRTTCSVRYHTALWDAIVALDSSGP